ncbi:hypothetical protein EELLY_v1c04320 [Entomoplasma ellychniae]|uniref:Uncharacterized protein n=1 Tax=Entomoplasma ellychniae TaxID=2114 RepID=A0A8E2QW30_9MOLU|nr:hypothetical protein [Entomoplasma ellychniae]PPE04752.1 hypothetical protein EELLY_v1c04320 [Entomoplasma ellychniae]
MKKYKNNLNIKLDLTFFIDTPLSMKSIFLNKQLKQTVINQTITTSFS